MIRRLRNLLVGCPACGRRLGHQRFCRYALRWIIEATERKEVA